MSYLSDRIQNIEPYVPGEQPKDGTYIKLNTNENPYPPSPKVIEAIKAAAGDRLRLYPDPECASLKSAYAASIGLRKENVFIGNGSDEVLAIAFQAFFMNKKEVLIPDISYSFYPVYADLYNVKCRIIPVMDDFRINIKDYMIPNSGIVIANPNAPTSLALSLSEIEDIIKNNRDSVVLIDEAYVDFGAESAVKLIEKYDNLLVTQTLSKSRSLAGLRVGFAAGSAELIRGMETVKNSFNSYTVDLLAQAGAEAAIKDCGYFEKMRNKVIGTRERTADRLREIGFEVLDSKTNFLFIHSRNKKAEDIFQYLRKNMILVRYFNKPRISDFLRVSIGTDEEMDNLLSCLSDYMI